ncbi:hypothetical protein BH09ACT1_BH09ACT1_26140 [soil metagenome]
MGKRVVSQSRTRPSGTTDVAYSYDANGNRTAQKSSSGASTSYAYTGAGRLASVTKAVQSTSYRYDGLGRSLETVVKSSVGTEKTTSAWDGLAVMQQSSSLTGTATLVRDALGQVALTATSSGAARSLQDRAGSTVAQTNAAGAVTDVVDYSDLGVPVYGTTGWSSATGYTGEQTDATTGLNTYFARAYDPMAGTWLTADSYGGTVTDPTSQKTGTGMPGRTRPRTWTCWGSASGGSSGPSATSSVMRRRRWCLGRRRSRWPSLPCS